jgi:hypothetical protein
VKCVGWNDAINQSGLSQDTSCLGNEKAVRINQVVSGTWANATGFQRM